MNNAVGRADVFALLERGVTVGIGTDGMTPDLRREAMTGYLLHKHHTGDNNLGWVEYEQMTMRKQSCDLPASDGPASWTGDRRVSRRLDSDRLLPANRV